ncbi:uncharacterized protein Bfra_007661 [Botrytis fragariae]|uniref:Uncharacterized protein n=1 Tax=Botrytis fragariae TaxID=1964551 RepID=A0A8H6AP91_9HELO|nr:uncharacterized protein Bfra_007661 [Botrytis fragariae]KAF5871147.1 hypothetical protein Bfra_007661 [Botrytis fragariae]
MTWDMQFAIHTIFEEMSRPFVGAVSENTNTSKLKLLPTLFSQRCGNSQNPIARANLFAVVFDKIIFRPQLMFEDLGQVTDTAGEESMRVHRPSREVFAFFHVHSYPKMNIVVTGTIVSYQNVYFQPA